MRRSTAGEPCSRRNALRLAFTTEEHRTQRRSDGTVTIAGQRFEIPARYRLLSRVAVRYANNWDLAYVHLIDERTDTVLARLYPLDKAKNADGRSWRRVCWCFGALVLRPIAKHTTRQADTLAVGIICLATSLTGFHRGYHPVLLAVLAVAAEVPGALPIAHRGLQVVLLTLYATLAVNWITTESVLQAWQPSHTLWLAVTSVNGLCLVALLFAYLGLGVRCYRGGAAVDGT